MDTIDTLIEFLDSQKTQKMPMEIRDFGHYVGIALEKEPHRIGELYRSFENMLFKLMDQLPEDERARPIDNFAVAILYADDADIEDSLIFSSWKGMWSDPKSYGTAMRAFADYVGLEGEALGEYVHQEPN